METTKPLPGSDFDPGSGPTTQQYVNLRSLRHGPTEIVPVQRGWVKCRDRSAEAADSVRGESVWYPGNARAHEDRKADGSLTCLAAEALLAAALLGSSRSALSSQS